MKQSQLASTSIIVIVVLLTIITSKTVFDTKLSHQKNKYITVTGSAEMSIEPDEVEMAVEIHCAKADLKKHENELVVLCKKYKIPDSQLVFKTSASFSNNYWWNSWYYRSVSYTNQVYKLKINSGTNLLSFVTDLNKSWIQNIRITATSNKDLQTYRKELKKEAMHMAKEKAIYLLEAIDEKVGSVISVEELASDTIKKVATHNAINSWYWNNPTYTENATVSSNTEMNAREVGNDNNITGIDKIKLRYEVKTVFEVK